MWHLFVLILRLYCRFSYAETWELINLFAGTKNFSYHICCENLAKYSKYLRGKRQIDRVKSIKVVFIYNWTICYKEKCIKWLSEVVTFAQGFKDWRKIKRTTYQNLDDLQNLLTKLTVKARAEKAWLLYEFPFSVNPHDKPNVKTTDIKELFIIISSNYRIPVPSIIKKSNWMGH